MSSLWSRNWIPATPTFLKEEVLNWWQQLKQKMGANTLVPLTWDKFKIFLPESLEEARVYMDDIRKKFINVNKYQ